MAYIINGRYSCTVPTKIYRARPPRRSLDIVKFYILDNITSDELDILFSEDLVFVDTETDTVVQFPDYKMAGRVDLRYGYKTQITLERQVSRDENYIQKSSS